MNADFPIPTLSRLPTRINPCPIVEAILEIRFTTTESWRTLPGLFYANIRERYPEQRDLPLAQFPEDFRRQESSFTYLPLIQFLSQKFVVQFGPRVISLVTKPNNYPGWSEIEQEMVWLLKQLRQSAFISEGERLGVRYIDFFANDVFDLLILGVNVGGDRLSNGELVISTVFKRAGLTVRLHVSNSAILGDGKEARRGSVLDLDVWLGTLDFDLFENGLQKFGEAHQLVKEIFFGLLKPESLLIFNPVYE